MGPLLTLLFSLPSSPSLSLSLSPSLPPSLITTRNSLSLFLSLENSTWLRCTQRMSFNTYLLTSSQVWDIYFPDVSFFLYVSSLNSFKKSFKSGNFLPSALLSEYQLMMTKNHITSAININKLQSVTTSCLRDLSPHQITFLTSAQRTTRAIMTQVIAMASAVFYDLCITSAHARDQLALTGPQDCHTHWLEWVLLSNRNTTVNLNFFSSFTRYQKERTDDLD